MLISRDPVKRHKSIFNLIAPIYGALDSMVKKGFKKAIENVTGITNIEGKTVLDIGTGAAAWGSWFADYGAKVHGVDFAPLMIAKARKLYGDKMEFSVGNGMNLEQFDDNSFDIVTTSFVLHGFPFKKRNLILKEMHRISKDLIIVNDYHGPTPAIGRFLEFMEGSDYLNFKKNFPDELKAISPHSMACKAGTGQAVYFGAKDPNTLKGKQCVKKQVM
jgi:ubiquinone/menaquinone biosynthesis C-methylase UbiE